MTYTRRRWWWALGALAAGVATGLGFAPYHAWYLMPLALAAFFVAARRVRPAFGLLVGYVFGLGFYGLLIHWISALSWAVLGVLAGWMAFWYAVVGLTLALTRHRRGGWLVGVAVWLAGEWAGARWPFGGFGWGRLAFATPGTPIGGLLPLISASGVSALIVTTGFALGRLAETGFEVRTRGAAGVVLRRPAIIVVVFLLVSGPGGLLGGLYQPSADGRAVTAAVVQGNEPGAGIDALGPEYTTENNHLSETILLAARVRTGVVAAPDLVAWPENSTATDPSQDARTHAIITAAVDLVGAPILVGAITLGPGDNERQTTGLWWTTNGVTATYHKRNLVPFGEWVPFRSVLEPLLPVLQYVGAQSIPGTTPGVLDVSVAGEPLRVGDIICFELAYDATFDSMMTGDAATGGGAQLTVVQTSNAMFTGTDQMSQQDAITRVRALESRRPILVATTNSLAGLIDANGSVVQEASLRTADSLVFTVSTSTTLTPAVRWRGWCDLATVLVPLVVGAGAALSGRGRPWKNGARAKESP